MSDFVTGVTLCFLWCHRFIASVYGGCDTVTGVTPIYGGAHARARARACSRCHTCHRWNTLIVSRG